MRILERDYKAVILLGNINGDTFKKVLEKLKEELNKNKNDNIININYHMYIVDTKESYSKMEEEIHKIRNIFGEDAIITEVVLDDNLGNTYDQLTEIVKIAIRIHGKDSVIVDLTNGQKIYSAVLYAVSSLIGIDSIYQLIKNDNGGYEYKKIPKFNKILELPKIGKFEILYYMEELEKIFNDIFDRLNNKNPKDKDASVDGSFIEYCYNRIKDGILKYFETIIHEEDDYQSSITETTKWVEGAIYIVHEFVTSRCGCNFSSSKTAGKIENIERCIKHDNNRKCPKDLRGIPHILEYLWQYRNIVSHHSTIRYKLSKREAVIAIKLSLEFFNRTKEVDDLLEKFAEPFWRGEDNVLHST